MKRRSLDRFSLWILLLGLVMSVQADSVWLYEINEIEQNGIVASIRMRYLLNEQVLYYEVDLVNKTGKPVSFPPLKYDEKPPYLGIEPFYDIYLNINGKWTQWVENQTIKDRWQERPSGMAYFPIFARAVPIDTKRGLVEAKLVDSKHPDGIRLSYIPAWPQAIKLVFPYKIDGQVKQANFELNIKSLMQYQALIK